MRTSYVFAAVWFAAVCSGCVAVAHPAAVTTQSAVDDVDANRTVGELVTQLRYSFNPATTVFAPLTGGRPDALGSALESALRRSGYAVANSGEQSGAVPIACSADMLDAQMLRVTLTVGDTFQASRVYVRSAEGALEPESAITRRGEPAATPRRLRVSSRSAVPGAIPKVGASPRFNEAASDAKAAGASVAPAKVRPIAKSETATPRPAAVVAVQAIPPPIQEAAPRQSPSPVEGNDLVTVVPNTEGVIEISGALFSALDGGVQNPFLQQYRGDATARELTITVAGIVLGPQPTTVLNGKVYAIGDHIESFLIAAIQQDLVVLRWENFVLQIPLQERPVVVRYP